MDVTQGSSEMYLINVNGKKFRIGKNIFSQIEPFLELGSFRTAPLPEGKAEYFIDRHVQSFAAILDYHKTGELHMPTDICPMVFKRELKAWGVNWKVMGQCCLKRFIGFQQTEASLQQFDRTLYERSDVSDSNSVSCLGRLRSKGWALLDDPRSSFWAKFILLLSTAFVLLSIFAMAASTHKSFHRPLVNDEWEEFLTEDEIKVCQEEPNEDSPNDSLANDVTQTTPGNKVVKRSLDEDDETAGSSKNTDQATHGRTDKMAWISSKEYVSGQSGSAPVTGSDTPDQVVGDISKSVRTFLKFINGQNNPHHSKDSLLHDILRLKSAGISAFTLRDLVDSVADDERTRFARHVMAFFGKHLTTSQTENEVTRVDDTVDDVKEEQPDNGSSILHRLRRATSNTTLTTPPLTLVMAVNSSTCYLATSDVFSAALGIVVSTPQAVTNCSKVRPADAYAVQKWLDYVEMTCIAYFTLEFVARFVFAPSKCRIVCNVLTMIDFISVVVMYLVILLEKIDPRAKYTPSYIDVINCLQLIRVLRFFRLVKYVTGFRVLVFSVRSSWRELSLLVMYITISVTLFSTVIYFLERDNMKSIPDASWWVIVTMTTVGYGDMVPATFKGKLVGSLCAISGVLLIAVTVPVFVNNFLLFYEHSKIKEAEIESLGQNSLGQDSSGSEVTEDSKETSQIFTLVALDGGQKMEEMSMKQNDSIVKNGVKPPSYGQRLNSAQCKRPGVAKVTPVVNM